MRRERSFLTCGLRKFRNALPCEADCWESIEITNGVSVSLLNQTSIEAEHGIGYGVASGETLLLDAYRPVASGAPCPAVILIHGGGMWTGSRSDMAEPARELAKAGYVACSIDYRLVDAASGLNRWPAQLDDAQRAVRWIRANAGRFGVDPRRIGSYGWSAGGQLAALLGTRETRDNSNPALAAFSSRVSCVVDLAGDVDLSAYIEPPARDEVIALLGGTYEEVPEQYHDASPLSWIDGDTTPFLAIHGLQDDVVPMQQSRRLVAALRGARVEVEHLELPDVVHHEMEWPRVGSAVCRFLNQNLHLGKA